MKGVRQSAYRFAHSPYHSAENRNNPMLNNSVLPAPLQNSTHNRFAKSGSAIFGVAWQNTTFRFGNLLVLARLAGNKAL